MPFTTAICNNILSFYFGYAENTVFAKHNNVYIALSTNRPEDDDGTFNELPVGVDGYQRVLLLNKLNEAHPDYLTTPSARAVYNDKEIHFNKATAAWPELNGFALYSDKSGGTMIYYANLDNPVNVPQDGVALFDPNTLKISFADKDVADDEATA